MKKYFIWTFVIAYTLGWLFSAGFGYYRCRQDAFQRYCDHHFFGAKEKIEWLDLNKNDGAL